MKKTPFLLSTLALAAGTTGILNTALNFTAPVSAIEITTSSQQDSDLYFEDINAMNEYFRIEELNFEENRMTYNVNKYTVVGGIQAQRTMIVARDYEAGITEAEADAKSHSLGADNDSTWYKPLVNTRVVAATNYEPKIKNYNLKDNLPDILYFAIRFGELVTDANGKQTLKDDFWVRGKFDYRKCVHSKYFDAKTMVCTAMMDYSTRTATLAAIDSKGDYVILPENEQVLTWDEEWGSVLKERLAGLNEQLTHMNTQLPAVEATLAQMVAAIKNIQNLAGQLGDGQDLAQSMNQTETLVQEVQKTYDWMLGAEQRKIMDDLRTALNDALAEIERLKQQQSTDDKNNQDMIFQYQQELEQLRKELLGLQGDLSKVNTQLRLETTNLTATKQELTKVEAKMKEILVEKEEVMQRLQNLINDKALMEAENNQIKQDKADLQKENSELSITNTNLGADKMGLMKQNVALKAQNEGLQAENRSLAIKNATLKEENISVAAKNKLLEEENAALIAENEALKTKIKELEQSVTEKPTCTIITEVQAENGTTMENVEPTDMTTKEEQSTSVETVEVPNLGEVETKTNFWWVLAGLVAALGVFGVYCKKCLHLDH